MWIVATTSSFEVGEWIFLAGPIAGGAMYWLIFQYYRNTNKSHQYERETKIESQPAVINDVKVRTRRKTSQSKTPNENGKDHRRRVQRIQ